MRRNDVSKNRLPTMSASANELKKHAKIEKERSARQSSENKRIGSKCGPNISHFGLLSEFLLPRSQLVRATSAKESRGLSSLGLIVT
jgi:hypothetical protein